jgi:hypothetical protein
MKVKSDIKAGEGGRDVLYDPGKADPPPTRPTGG